MKLMGSSETRLIVIRGNSGSGKSALATALRAAWPREVAMIGQDQMRREILHVKDKPGTLAADYIALSVRFALDHAMDVIVEGILYEEIYGGTLRSLIADHRGLTRCYRYDLSFGETLRRHAMRPQAGSFGEEEMRSWWRESDVLGGVTEAVIGADDPLDETVSRVLADCRLVDHC